MKLQIAVAQEGELWVAHSVDHVISTQGESIDEAVREMVCAYIIRIELGKQRDMDLFKGLEHRSPQLKEAFDRGNEVKVPQGLPEMPAHLLMQEPSIAVRLMQ